MTRHRSDSTVFGLIQAAERAGWTVEDKGSKGWRILPPGGLPQIVIRKGPPSGYRSFRNSRALLRRAGLDV